MLTKKKKKMSRRSVHNKNIFYISIIIIDICKYPLQMAMNDEWYILIQIIPNDKMFEHSITDIKNYIICG